MAAVPRWSLEALLGFLEPLVADPDMGYCDGEGPEHDMLRASIHIRRRAFSWGGFKFFCWHKFLELESVTMRISIWSVKKKQKQVRPQKWFSKDRKLSRSLKRLWSEQPRYGDIRGPSLPSLLCPPHSVWLSQHWPPAHGSHFCTPVGKRRNQGRQASF